MKNLVVCPNYQLELYDVILCKKISVTFFQKYTVTTYTILMTSYQVNKTLKL